jgi:vacuolar-type H+-ATPase subunit F/Vma7
LEKLLKDGERMNTAKDNPQTPGGSARLIALGGAALTDGFKLIGFETYPDATLETLEEVLAKLITHDQSALVFLEHHLARSESTWLVRAHNAARIVICEIPALNEPDSYHPKVEALVRTVLGAGALEERL